MSKKKKARKTAIAKSRHFFAFSKKETKIHGVEWLAVVARLRIRRRGKKEFSAHAKAGNGSMIGGWYKSSRKKARRSFDSDLQALILFHENSPGMLDFLKDLASHQITVKVQMEGGLRMTLKRDKDYE